MCHSPHRRRGHELRGVASHRERAVRACHVDAQRNREQCPEEPCLG
jgi:hypothetical protein